MPLILQRKLNGPFGQHDTLNMQNFENKYSCDELHEKGMDLIKT